MMIWKRKLNDQVCDPVIDMKGSNGSAAGKVLLVAVPVSQMSVT